MHRFFSSKQLGILLNFLLLANAATPLYAGFGAGTLVKTSDSFAQIQDLIIGDYVASFYDNKFLADNVIDLGNLAWVNIASVIDDDEESEADGEEIFEDDDSMTSDGLLINMVLR